MEGNGCDGQCGRQSLPVKVREAGVNMDSNNLVMDRGPGPQGMQNMQQSPTILPPGKRDQNAIARLNQVERADRPADLAADGMEAFQTSHQKSLWKTQKEFLFRSRQTEQWNRKKHNTGEAGRKKTTVNPVVFVTKIR
jgi:hypothetical protein